MDDARLAAMFFVMNVYYNIMYRSAALSPHVVTSEYDNEWEIRVAPQNGSGLLAAPGAFIGNGKIGVVVALDRLGADRSVISYDGGCCPCFDTHSFRFESASQHAYIVELDEQRLDMYTGIVQSRFTARRGLDRHKLAVDAYVAKHMPYTHVQTVTFTAEEDIPAMHVYHTVKAPDTYEKLEFNNNAVFNERSRLGKPVYMLTGKAKVSDRGIKVASCCCYVVDNPNTSVMGFNIDSKDRKACHQRLNMYDLKRGASYTFHVVTTQVTSDDSKDPLEEAKRIQLSIMCATSSPIAKVRSHHVMAWANAWRHNVTIEPRAALSVVERDRVHRVNKVLRLSLFAVWCSVRDALFTTGMPFVDLSGSLEGDCDLWLLPLLVVMRPNLARNMLERRHAMLQDAIRRAAGYGYSGSKFPGPNEGTWDATGAMHIYSTALVSVNVWNYYRVTLDKNWLSNKGYEMLQSNADFFASRTDRDGSFSIRGVISMNGMEEDNNTMTNYLAMVAMRYAIEASFELGLPTNPDWHLVLQKMSLSRTGTLLNTNDSKEKTEFMMYDHLLPLLPMFSDVYFRAHPGKASEAIKANVVHTLGNSDMAHVDNVFNIIMIAWLRATAMDLDSDDMVQAAIDCAQSGIWEDFNNNISLAAMFVLMVVTSIGTLRISGCVTDTRFYTERLGIKVSPTNVMPKLWKGVRISGVGTSPTSTHYVVNTAA